MSRRGKSIEREALRRVEAAGRWMADPGPLVPSYIALVYSLDHEQPVLPTHVSCPITHLYIPVSINKIDVLLPHQKKRKKFHSTVDYFEEITFTMQGNELISL